MMKYRMQPRVVLGTRRIIEGISEGWNRAKLSVEEGAVA